MVGEYGGIGWAAPGHEWLPGMCQKRSAGNFNTSAAGAAVLLKELAEALQGKQAGNISAIVYTQITDVELECDGIYAMPQTSCLPALGDEAESLRSSVLLCRQASTPTTGSHTTARRTPRGSRLSTTSSPVSFVAVALNRHFTKQTVEGNGPSLCAISTEIYGCLFGVIGAQQM
jgi:hypothetical protein